VEREDDMRKSLFTVGSLTALLLACAIGSATADTCQDELNNHVYRCQVKADDGAAFESCFRFTSPGLFSTNFDLNINNYGDLGCECKAEGSFKRPKFETSDEFHCVAVYGTTFFNLAVEGEADDYEIVDGQAVNDSGRSFVIACKLDRACELPPAVSSVGSPWGR
jgi:hypothetical protein